MKALKYNVTIGKDHRVVLTIPEAEGPAEVIVLVPEEQHVERTLVAFFRDFALRPRTIRTCEEIDRSIEDERSSWD